MRAFIASFFILTLLAVGRGHTAPAMVIDAETGLVIYAEDQYRLWPPASLTKLMTAFITFEAIRDGQLSLEDTIQCSQHAMLQPPSKIGLPVGGQITVDLGLKALMVKSANDVAVMLAEKISGSEAAFVARMNETAKRLGMSRTTFHNSNGLPHPQQVTTAHDMAVLGRALLKEFPQHGQLYSMTSFQIGKRTLSTHNEIFRIFEGADGLKTGFICASGYNVVTSATRNGRRMIAVVLGATSGMSRGQRAADLMDYGFSHYGWKSLFNASIEAAQPPAASVLEVPGNVSDIVCSGRRLAGHIAKRKRAAKKKAAKAAAAKPAAKPGG
ncbi:MAG: D-alanyl-D-alanine carboxypeptidase family protein [Hyphomicrobiales bacterium]|nr:D-alanyl-D-alanine carboxypeptidase family protein [Hyphomicrobiales bacterium]